MEKRGHFPEVVVGQQDGDEHSGSCEPAYSAAAGFLELFFCRVFYPGVEGFDGLSRVFVELFLLGASVSKCLLLTNVVVGIEAHRVLLAYLVEKVG